MARLMLLMVRSGNEITVISNDIIFHVNRNYVQILFVNEFRIGRHKILNCSLVVCLEKRLVNH
jgi:hypothetical protein